MKKLLLFLLAVLMAFAACFFAVAEGMEGSWQERYTCGEYDYVIREDGTAEIVWCSGEEKELMIPEELDGNPVTHIRYTAFAGCFSLEKVIIPDSVTEIGAGAFFSCQTLESIAIPRSVIRIGSQAFENCSSLKTVTCFRGSVAEQCCTDSGIAMDYADSPD